MNTELFPCPLCGEQPEINPGQATGLDTNEESFSVDWCSITCKCGLQMTQGDDNPDCRQAAIAAWNTRAPSPEPTISPAIAQADAASDASERMEAARLKVATPRTEKLWCELVREDYTPMISWREVAFYFKSLCGEIEYEARVPSPVNKALLEALQALIQAGEEIAGYTLEEGHESPQADFLRALNKAAAALASATP